MAVGARDFIDRELVKKYAKLQMDKIDAGMLVDSQKMLSAMADYASIKRGMMEMDKKLKEICAAVNSKSARYVRIKFNPQGRRAS